MPVMPVDNLFGTSTKTAREFFTESNSAFYIPFYQREYSWGTSNIEQLFEDITQGIDYLLNLKNSDDRKSAIRFLGTVILLNETSPFYNIQPKDSKAMPGKVKKVIDGQQRISTIALLSTFIYDKIDKHSIIIGKDSTTLTNVEDLIQTAQHYKSLLKRIFSVDIERGNPTLKPAVIRGSVDEWTFNGTDDKYRSEIANYIAKFIRYRIDKPLKEAASKQAKAKPADPSSKEKIGFESKILKSVGRMIEQELKQIEDYHKSKNDDLILPAWTIVEKGEETDLWIYERPALKSEILSYKQSSVPLDRFQSAACSLVQLFMFCHYMLERCCFTVIEPNNEGWAFDMFQSLNATGTPLTSIETFKPKVVNTLDRFDGGFRESLTATYFEEVDTLLSSESTPDGKTKLTNEFLVIFALLFNGSKMEKQFSVQRGYLLKEFPEEDGTDEKKERENFVKLMSDVAIYLKKMKDVREKNLLSFKQLDGDQTAILNLCLLYLQKAGHRMSNMVLAKFYSRINDDIDGAELEFYNAVIAVAAFYTLWRAASSNSGLDDAYRTLATFHLSLSSEIKNKSLIDSAGLKNLLKAELKKKDIGERKQWLEKAKSRFSYDEASQTVCRFSLFLIAENTMVDPAQAGLFKRAANGFRTYLEPSRWLGGELETVEHIAPQTPSGGWDPDIYKSEGYDIIGNLTLLPISLNSSAGNKSWKEKWYYYSFVAEQDPQKREEIAQNATSDGISLENKTLEELKKSTHGSYLKNVISVSKMGDWDRKLIEERTDKACEVVWEILSEWLS